MTWNTKYGHMAGAGQQLTRDRARQIAQTWLNQAFPGAKAEAGTPFYGYLTFDFERNGKMIGMASVNAFTGQAWHHNWHGAFIREKELK